MCTRYGLVLLWVYLHLWTLRVNTDPPVSVTCSTLFALLLKQLSKNEFNVAQCYSAGTNNSVKLPFCATADQQEQFSALQSAHLFFECSRNSGYLVS